MTADSRRRDDAGRDYYAVLGVPETATHDEIIRAYRRQARASHPDVDVGNPQATDEFERLVAAREVLGDPAARAAYDQLRRGRAAAHQTRRPANDGPMRLGGHLADRPGPPVRPGPVVWKPDSPR